MTDKTDIKALCEACGILNDHGYLTKSGKIRASNLAEAVRMIIEQSVGYADQLEAERQQREAAEGEPDGYIFCHPTGKLFWSIVSETCAGDQGVHPYYFTRPLKAARIADLEERLRYTEESLIAANDLLKAAQARVKELTSGQRPVDLSYSVIFNAIAAATKVHGNAVSISVETFNEAIGVTGRHIKQDGE